MTDQKLSQLADRLSGYAKNGYHPDLWDDCDYASSIIRGLIGAGWQPMDTAPKDGTRVLGFVPRGSYLEDRVDVVYWETQIGNGPGWTTEGLQEHFYEVLKVPPTHWMPLPEPPTS